MTAKGMVPADKAPFTLRRATGTLAEGAARLAADIGAAAVEAVLEQANRKGVRKGAPGALGTMQPRPADWYAFDEKDNDTADWYPQGLTCREDSGSAGAPVFVASWYFKPTPPVAERGIRVTFLSPVTLRYQHALLVEAKPDGSYGPINIHAGGIAWYGEHLYVADTKRGLRVFDVNHILDLRAAQGDLGDPTRIGRDGGKFHAFGYRYVIPQTDFWRVATPEAARFSFVAVDRSTSPHALVSGEYVDEAPAGRVARWDLPLGDGVPRDAFAVPHLKIQGAVSSGGRWYLSQTVDARSNGRLIVDGGGKATIRPFPIGPEDLTVSGGRVWSVTEFRNRRVIFGVPL
ncbi:hypothetical protein ACFXJ8_13345 [Nonomuraea sp. NPDC059194]|uniref:hypothetical protein n=1 Tax=Nonomuraea sp. NPDC059194 TaxID=3346764 RepID=UPI0036C8C045